MVTPIAYLTGINQPLNASFTDIGQFVYANGEIIQSLRGKDNLKAALILGLRPANERRRYFVATSLIGWGNHRISLVKGNRVSALSVDDMAHAPSMPYHQ